MEAITTQVDPFYRQPFEVNQNKNRIYAFQFPLQIRAAEEGWINYGFYIGQTDPSRGWLVENEFLTRWSDGDYSKCPEKPKLLAYVDVHEDILDHDVRLKMMKYGWVKNTQGSPEMITHPTLKSWDIAIRQFLIEIDKLDNYYKEFENKFGFSPSTQRKKSKNKEEDMYRVPPVDLVADMCNKLKDLPRDAKIYVTRDAHGHFCDYLVSMGFENLYTEEEYEYFPKNFKASFAGLEDVNLVSEDKIKDMHFDATIGNPPYIKSKHLEFLLTALEKSDNVVLVHPAGWMFRSDRSIEKQVRNALKNRVCKLELFNGNSKFPGARFGCPLVVTTAKKYHEDKIEIVYGTTGNSYYLNSLDDIPSGFWEPTELHLETVKKYKQLTERYSIYDLMRNYNGSGYAVSTPRVCGHANFVSTPRVCGNQTNSAEDFVSYDFYTFFYRNSDILTLDKKNKLFQVSSKEERDSLISYLKTKVARFGLSICKVSQDAHIERYLNNVPLPPLDRQWTEDSIMEYYNFSEEQRNLINTFISDYYHV